jgi:transcriptional regulator NrdR family protein
MPSIQMKDGRVVQIAVPLLVMNGTRAYGEKSYRNMQSGDILNKGYDNVWILTKDEGFMAMIQDLKLYDTVMVKGTIRVTSVKKKTLCPECGAKHVFQSTKTTIYPISMHKIDSVSQRYNVTSFHPGAISQETESKMKQESMDKLAEFIELSNTVRLIGVVCKEPDLYQRDSDGRPMLTFPLAVKRKYFVPEDDMSINVDFPYVKLYGSKAKQHYGILHKANLIMVDGFVHSREIIRKITCPACQIQYTTKDNISEIIPYSIDYIRSNISETEFGSGENLAYRPQIIGSEADIDLKYVTPEERIENDVASGNGGNAIDQKIQDILATMNDD